MTISESRRIWHRSAGAVDPLTVKVEEEYLAAGPSMIKVMTAAHTNLAGLGR
jgi:hypothetical protein